MNIIDLQERLKDLPENALMQEMQTPTGTAPQFLVLSELKRRKRMRDDYQRQEAQGMQTVAEEAITAAGMPQEGIMGLAQGMAPRSAIAQDTGVNDMMQQDSVRAPQPEQPMMMAGGGIVRRMQDGGFTDRLRRIQQEGYLAFLNIMNLQDSPESREMYAQYGQTPAAAGGTMPDETRARLDLISRLTDPDSSFRNQLDQFSAQLSDFGTQPQPMGEAPQGIASISADVSSFLPSMPGTDSRPTMMTAPPVLGAAPTADGIDFDASDGPSVTQSRLSPTRMMMTNIFPGSAQLEVDDFNSAQRELDRGAEARAQSNAGLSNDPNDPTNVFLGDPDAAARVQALLDAGIEFSDAPPGVGIIPSGGFGRVGTGFVDRYRENRDNRLATQPEMEAERELREINARLQDPDLSERERGFLENRKSVLEFQFKVAESPSFLMELIDSGAAGIRSTLDPLIAGGMSYFSPTAAMDYDAYSGAVISGFERKAGESAEAYDARLKALGIGDEEISATVRLPVENQNLSFGLDGMDIPGSGTSLSFDNVTSSAANIPFSMGEPVIPDPSLGESVLDPAATPPVRDTVSGGAGGSGAGGFGPIESRIARMLEEREKSAQADKWLALAQTGLALMASDQPTLGGAIGEAGLAGIGAMQQARSQYDKDIMGLLDMQAGVQRARSAGARASTSTSALNSMIDDARQELSNLNSEARTYRQVSVDNFGESRLVDLTPLGLKAQIVAAQSRLDQLNALRSGSADTAQFDATAK